MLLEYKNANTAIQKIRRKGTKVSANNPLVDCLKIPGDILYVLEGDCAKGTMRDARKRANKTVAKEVGKQHCKNGQIRPFPQLEKNKKAN